MKVELHGTTILCLSHKGDTVMAGDGQVTFNQTVLKSTAKKVRRLYENKVLAGFAGSTADAFTLFERFEHQLQKYRGDLVRSSVELAKDWRTDRSLRRLEALLIVANEQKQFILSGMGDVIEPDENCSAIGSGGQYARAAALALKRHAQLSAEQIVRESMGIAGEICIFTNSSVTLEKLSNGTDKK